MTLITVRDAAQNELVTDTQKERIDLPNQAATVTELDLQGAAVVETLRQGDDLVIELSNGRKIVLEDYFVELPDDARHRLLIDSGEGLAEAQFGEAFSSASASATEAAVAGTAGSGSFGIPGGGLLAGLLGLGVAAGASGGGGDDAQAVVINQLAAGAETTLSGTASEPNTEVEIFDSEDNLLGTTTTNDEGEWAFTPDVPLEDGTTISVRQTDGTGNTETATQTVALDFDGDGVANTADIDDDGDGIIDENEPAATIVNGSFEQDAGGLQTSLVGWTTTGNFDVGGYTPTDGANAIDLNGLTTGSISQTITTEPGTTYTLSFDYRPNLSGAADRAFEVNALNGSTTIGTREITANNAAMQRGDLTFTATGTETTIEFNSLEAGASGTFLDNITIGDADGDGTPDSLESDSDDGGISDNIEAQFGQNYVAPSGEDSDADGLDDAYDQADGVDGSVGLVPVDTDADDTPDAYQTVAGQDVAPITQTVQASILSNDDGGVSEANLYGPDLSLDLTGLGNGAAGTIDISGGGANELTLNLSDLVDLSAGSDALFVKGDAEDTVVADGNFTTNGSATIEGVTYDIYVDSSATLLIEENVNVNLI